ncbi:MAG TPA: metal-sensitive transcriptional regulator [Vitreimonas sp.]|nr:metal-sensitive transcriptional regulator [Vitreimonas sp.]
MFHTPTTKSNVLHRLKIARGHLEKVIQMVEADTYCIDVLVQSKAVQKSLAKADAVLLEQHLSHCVVEHIQQGQNKKAVEEIMKVFETK